MVKKQIYIFHEEEPTVPELSRKPANIVVFFTYLTQLDYNRKNVNFKNQTIIKSER